MRAVEIADAAQAAQQRGTPSPSLVTTEGGQIHLFLGQAKGLGAVEHTDPLIVAAVATLDVGGLRVVRRSQEHQFRSGRVDRRVCDHFGGSGAGHGRVEAVCRGHSLGPLCVQGSAVGGGSCRWNRHPGALRISAKRSGLTPLPTRALRGPAGSQPSLPDDLPSLSENPSERGFTNGGWWGNAQRRPRRHFSAGSVCTRSDAPKQGLFWRPLSWHRSPVRPRGLTTARRCIRRSPPARSRPRRASRSRLRPAGPSRRRHLLRSGLRG